MDCRKHPELLHQYFDGELDAATERDVRAALATCPECREHLDWLDTMRSGLAEPVHSEVASMSFDGLWEGIESQLPADMFAAAVTPAATPSEPSTARPDAGGGGSGSSWKDGFSRWMDKWSWGPMIGLAGAAAAAAIVFALWTPDESGIPAGGVASGDVTVASVDRASGREVNNLAFVSAIEVDSGFVIIDQESDDPTQPLIVWHVDDSAVEEDDGSQGG